MTAGVTGWHLHLHGAVKPDSSPIWFFKYVFSLKLWKFSENTSTLQKTVLIYTCHPCCFLGVFVLFSVTAGKQRQHSTLRCDCWTPLLISGFTLDVEPAAGICSHSDTRASVRSNTDVGWSGLAQSWCLSSSQRCRIGLSLGLCADQSSSSTPKWALCTGTLLCWNGKGTNTNCWHKVRRTQECPHTFDHVVYHSLSLYCIHNVPIHLSLSLQWRWRSYLP